MNQKPGYKTTEFYAMIANTILSVLAAVGIISHAEVTELNALVTPLITAVLGIVAYIWSRTSVKTK